MNRRPSSDKTATPHGNSKTSGRKAGSMLVRVPVSFALWNALDVARAIEKLNFSNFVRKIVADKINAAGRFFLSAEDIFPPDPVTKRKPASKPEDDSQQKALSIWLGSNFIKALDSERGRLSRSTYVRKCIVEHLNNLGAKFGDDEIYPKDRAGSLKSRKIKKRPLGVAVTHFDPTGRKFIGIIAAAFDEAAFSEAEARRVVKLLPKKVLVALMRTLVS